MDSLKTNDIIWMDQPCQQQQGKGGGGSAPAAPDPYAVAQAQSQANLDAIKTSAKYNQYNTQGPNGSVTWSGDIGTPNRTQITTLSPDGQAQLSNLSKIGLGLSDQLGQQQPFNIGASTPAYNASDLVGDANNVRDSVYNQQASRLDPQFAQSQTALDSLLANQGITQGSTAYNNAMDNYNRQKADTYQTAMNNAIAAGGNEQSRLFGLGQTAHQQSVSDLLMQRSQPLNELSAILQGRPAIGIPQGPTSSYNMQPSNIAGNIYNSYNGNLSAWNANNQNSAARNGQLAGLLGQGAMAGATFFG